MSARRLRASIRLRAVNTRSAAFATVSRCSAVTSAPRRLDHSGDVGPDCSHRGLRAASRPRRPADRQEHRSRPGNLPSWPGQRHAARMAWAQAPQPRARRPSARHRRRAHQLRRSARDLLAEDERCGKVTPRLSRIWVAARAPCSTPIRALRRATSCRHDAIRRGPIGRHHARLRGAAGTSPASQAMAYDEGATRPSGHAHHRDGAYADLDADACDRLTAHAEGPRICSAGPLMLAEPAVPALLPGPQWRMPSAANIHDEGKREAMRVRRGHDQDQAAPSCTVDVAPARRSEPPECASGL